MSNTRLMRASTNFAKTSEPALQALATRVAQAMDPALLRVCQGLEAIGSEIVGFGAAFDRDQVCRDVWRELSLDSKPGPSKSVVGMGNAG